MRDRNASRSFPVWIGWRGPAICLLTVCAICVAERSAAASDWPMWRYDAGHTAASPHELPAELHLRWTRQYSPRQPVWEDALNQDMMQYDRVFEPVVSAGRMFVNFNDTDKVVALDAESGKQLWAFYADGPVRFSPVAFQGKVYFTSDDGCLYCVAAVDGKLHWRVRGGPSARKGIGNRRVISSWPARGGPVIRDGVVYFAASIWPFMGTFIYAVDANSGEVLWKNDATGSQFIKQPHSAPSFAGVAPQGQLTVAGNKLLVPGGRSCPAVFDRTSGELLYFDFGGKGEGGSFVAADDTRFFVHTRVRGTTAFQLDDGKEFGLRVNEPVLSQGMVYAPNTPGDVDGKAAAPVVQAFDREKKLVWQIEADGSGDMIMAGSRLYAAGRESLVAIELPQGENKASIAWSMPIDGHIVRLLAAADRLFAVTLDGRIMAFSGDKTSPSQLAARRRSDGPSEETVDRAEELLHRFGADEGYALWFGVDDPPLLEAVALNSRLHIVAIDPDGQKVAQLRRYLDQVGLYGTRVTLHEGDLATFSAPPYMASVTVVSAAMLHATSDRQVFRRIYESVRPYGGKLWIPSANAQSIADELRAADLPKAKISVGERGVMVIREGALPGAADWTHAYGDVAQTVKSDDRRVKLPLGILWFGGTTNADILPRHSHAPSEQVIGGRLFVEGINSVSARDVYTGRSLWNREFADLGTFEVYYDDTYADAPLSTAYNQVHIPGANARGTNMVATDEGVYLALGSKCLLLDAATGKTLKEFSLTAASGADPPLWGFLGVYKNLLLAGTGFGDYSRRLGYKYPPKDKKGLAWGPDRSASLGLTAFDRHTGRIVWKVDAHHSFLHNGIVAGGGRIYCLDKLPKRVEEYNRRRGIEDSATFRVVALDVDTGAELWKTTDNVFGTWLSYSEDHDVLLLAGAAASDRSADEVGKGMATYRGRDGSLLWEKPDLSYAGPCILHHDSIITNTTSYKSSQGAFHISDGSPVTNTNPLTGELEPWRFTRTYGCNTAVASEYLLTFRSGAAGFYDLATHCGTGNLGGFKSGCSSNLIAANGVLNAPDYTRTCSCGYQNQTSLALVHMPENELWTYNVFDNSQADTTRIARIGLNLGAPGDHRSEDGTLWLDYPVIGGDSPAIDVEMDGSLDWFRYHSSQVSGDGLPAVTASGVRGVRALTVWLVPRLGFELKRGISLASGDDDAEEDASGKVGLTSSDLELTKDSGPQTIGIRFPALPLPPGRQIKRAYVQFVVDEPTTEPTTLKIRGQSTDKASAFASKAKNISSREKTESVVRWQPKPWSEKSAASVDQQTPNLAPLVQEIVSRPGWRKGNAIALLITGSGKRVATAFDGNKRDAPRLFVELEETVAGETGKPQVSPPQRLHTLRLYFMEPDARLQAGERVFDVVVQGETVLRGFDIVDQAGGPFRSIVQEFNGVSVADALRIEFNVTSGKAPVLCGVEVYEERP